MVGFLLQKGSDYIEQKYIQRLHRCLRTREGIRKEDPGSGTAEHSS